MACISHGFDWWVFGVLPGDPGKTHLYNLMQVTKFSQDSVPVSKLAFATPAFQGWGERGKVQCFPQRPVKGELPGRFQ